MTILAIETSCDETAAAVLQDGRLLSSVVASQEEHLQYGGVVPELASRAHIAKIAPVTREALKQADVTLEAVDHIAATHGPGLVGSLLVGLTFAKGLALAQNVPFLGVNHLEGHLYSILLDHPRLSFPYLALIVSGGHTILCLVHGVAKVKVLGQTRDDAAGEAFDKVAKILELPYPGGPAVEKLAAEGDPRAVKFPVARLKGGRFDFSFSGLKTAVLYHFNRLSVEEREAQRANIAASFQEAVVRALTRNIEKALKKYKVGTVVLAGGVARNRRLAEACAETAAAHGARCLVPSPAFCTDNAAMIAKAAELQFGLGRRSPLSLAPCPNLTLQEQ